MARVRRTDTLTRLTVEDFLASDYGAFGDAWRYELIDGVITGHDAPSPDHGAVVVNLAAALKTRLAIGSGCRAEAGTAAIPKGKAATTARIPDIVVRCDGQPRVMIEVVSPSELRQVRARDQKRRELQDVAGAAEIVEIYQQDYACHSYRRTAQGEWVFEAIDGIDAVLALPSLGLTIPLAEIYAGVPLAEPEAD
jgi:Uma2 family endonuclease